MTLSLSSIFWGSAIVFVWIWFCIFLSRVYGEIKYRNQIDRCKREVLTYIDAYTPRFNTRNRYKFDVHTMMMIFPDYEPEICATVFQTLIALQKVRKNQIDQEWELTPPYEPMYKMSGEDIIPKTDSDKLTEGQGISW